MKNTERPFVGISNREKVDKIWAGLINTGEMIKELTLLSDEELEKLKTELNQLIIEKNKIKELAMLTKRKSNA